MGRVAAVTRSILIYASCQGEQLLNTGHYMLPCSRAIAARITSQSQFTRLSPSALIFVSSIPRRPAAGMSTTGRFDNISFTTSDGRIISARTAGAGEQEISND